MLAGLQYYAAVKATPSATTILTVNNPLGVIPKFVHITCAHESAPYSTNGYVREILATSKFGIVYGTNGSGGADLVRIFSPVEQIPTAVDTYYISTDTISFYKGNGSVSGRWHTSTEYTVHCYA